MLLSLNPAFEGRGDLIISYSKLFICLLAMLTRRLTRDKRYVVQPKLKASCAILKPESLIE